MDFMLKFGAGALVAWLLLKNKATGASSGTACATCGGHGAVVLTDDSGVSCGHVECAGCAGTGQTVNPDLNTAGRYGAVPPMQVDVCGLAADARAGDMTARAMLDDLIAKGHLTAADETACLSQPALSTQKSTMMADGGQGFSVLGSDAVLDTRTAGGAGLTVLPAMNAISPVLPAFGDVYAAPANVCRLVTSAVGGDTESAGRLRMMLDNGMVRLTDIDNCKSSMSVSDQVRVTKLVTL